MTGRVEAPPRLIDARGLKCPWPVLRAARAMRDCGAITLLADDPVALIDVPALARAQGWRVHVREEGCFQRYMLEIAPQPDGR